MKNWKGNSQRAAQPETLKGFAIVNAGVTEMQHSQARFRRQNWRKVYPQYGLVGLSHEANNRLKSKFMWNSEIGFCSFNTA